MSDAVRTHHDDHTVAAVGSPSCSTCDRHLRSGRSRSGRSPAWSSPAVVGLLAGNLAAGLTASLGGFGGLFGGGRPYAYRFRLLVYLAAAQATAVFLGIWSGGDPWLAAVVVTVIAALATLFCNAFAVPPAAYQIVLVGSDRNRHGRPGGRSGPDLAAGPGRRCVRRSGARGARDRRPPFARTADRRGGGRGRRRLPRGDRRSRGGPGPPPGGRAAVRGVADAGQPAAAGATSRDPSCCDCASWPGRSSCWWPTPCAGIAPTRVRPTGPDASVARPCSAAACR